MEAKWKGKDRAKIGHFLKPAMPKNILIFLGSKKKKTLQIDKLLHFHSPSPDNVTLSPVQCGQAHAQNYHQHGTYT